MSVQFGKWNLDGKPVDRDYLEKVEALILPYGPDDAGSYSKETIGILYRAFHTTKESRHETEPYITTSGAVLTWDGRLDNREDLIHELSDVVTAASTDVAIVAAAYEEWATGCFGKLIGDWALSIWNPTIQSLILAKDPIGTRHLYYSFDNDQVTWSTILDPLVLFAGKTFALCEEYIAGWFSFFPAAHLTPYEGIHSVPPSCSVLLRRGKRTIQKYWDFDPSKKIRYQTDSEYEEHFRTVFAESIRRRLRSDSPILAELSGGMDSSSIVCMADIIMASGAAETPRLDTLSYYDDSEPNWNERPYFTKVEEKRGRTGTHIDVSAQKLFNFGVADEGFSATPDPKKHGRIGTEKFTACLESHGARVVLSGVGGDEVMGGVPTPTPELQDLLVKGQLNELGHQLKMWALNKRRPWFHLLMEAIAGFLPMRMSKNPAWNQPAPWLKAAFVKSNLPALQAYETRIHFFGAAPTFQTNISALAALRRQIESYVLSRDPRYEKRFPYLDRDLLEFSYSIPREQFVRPGQRRSLMRRALVGLVPNEILDRKRKAFVGRGPRAAIWSELSRLIELAQDMTVTLLGMVDQDVLSACLRDMKRNERLPITRLMRTVYLELWLRDLRKRGLVVVPLEKLHTSFNSLSQYKVSAERN